MYPPRNITNPETFNIFQCQQFFDLIKVDLRKESSEHAAIKTGESTCGIMVTLPINGGNFEFPNNKKLKPSSG